MIRIIIKIKIIVSQDICTYTIVTRATLNLSVSDTKEVSLLPARSMQIILALSE
jgi:hypothetical protein